MSGRGTTPPPDEATLRTAPLHVVVRTWPETLVVLLAAGVDLAAAGGEPLSRRPDADALAAACLAATAWRGGKPQSPSSQRRSAAES